MENGYPLLESLLHIHLPAWVVSQQSSKILNANDAAIKKYHYDHESLLTMTFDQISNDQTTGVCMHTSQSGNSFYVDQQVISIAYEEPLWLIIAYDINDKINVWLDNKVLEKDINKYANQIEAILESITDGFFALDEHLKFTYANDKFCEIFECSRNTVIGRHLWDIIPKKDGVDILRKCSDSFQSNKKISFTDFFSPLKVWYTLSVYPTEYGVSVYFKDITREKLLQNAIAVERLNLAALINNTEDLIWSIDKNYNLLSANEPFLKATQFGNKRLNIGNSIFANNVDQGRIKNWKKHYDRALNGETFRIEEISDDYNFQTRYCEVSFNPIRNKSQQIIGVGCFSKDITKKKKHEFILSRHELLNRAKSAGVESSKTNANGDLEFFLLQFLQQFDFNNLNSNENCRIISLLKDTTQQLDSLVKGASSKFI